MANEGDIMYVVNYETLHIYSKKQEVKLMSKKFYETAEIQITMFSGEEVAAASVIDPTVAFKPEYTKDDDETEIL